MKLFVDVGLGKRVEEWLAQNGYDAKNVRDLDPRMVDEDIISIAVAEKRIIITMDKDFGELVFKSGLAHCGILLLRLDDADGEYKCRVVAEILRNYSDKIPNSFCVYQNGVMRIR